MRIRRYETVFILEPDIEESRRRETLERLEGIIQKGGGLLVRRDDWGVRKLAYDIRRFSKGHYFLFDFAGPSRAVSEVERHLKMFEVVLRFLTVKKEDQVSLEAMEKLRAEEQEKEEARRMALQQRREAEAPSARMEPAVAKVEELVEKEEEEEEAEEEEDEEEKEGDEESSDAEREEEEDDD
jgi:small subunit ribosomal protein S6